MIGFDCRIAFEADSSRNVYRLRPISFFKLADKKRSPARNWQLGIVLAFVAGFVNAGGFFLVGRYTSHMTGILSEVADTAAIGHFMVSFLLLSFMACFIIGSALTTILVLICRKYALHAQFSLPLLIEAFLLSLLIAIVAVTPVGPVPIIALFCFVMGLQNALITKASTAVVRTTHVTGIVTDFGIELGRSLLSASSERRLSALTKVALFGLILISFLFGGIIGAILISKGGVNGLIPVVILLALLALPGIFGDLHSAYRRFNRRRRSI